jgi:hypothetical protein
LELRQGNMLSASFGTRRGNNAAINADAAERLLVVFWATRSDWVRRTVFRSLLTYRYLQPELPTEDSEGSDGYGSAGSPDSFALDEIDAIADLYSELDLSDSAPAGRPTPRAA